MVSRAQVSHPKKDAEFYEDSSDVLEQQTDTEVVEEYRERANHEDE